ncbi:MAG: neutral/alkaline non-lysosomal ceramidase N-terminal domain-containing protein [Halanaerobium sp.]|nr:neutral/alkaline non-lysosomal ceramidase N-terminal domain-containing protein [Halanaerobium sp.]
MKLGCSEIDITPDIPVLMGGYGAREEPARGIAKPLSGRSFFLSSKGLQVGLIIAELVLFDKEQVDRIRERAAELTGIPAGKIIVACTHTHSGPALRNYGDLGGKPIAGYEGPDEDYINYLIKALAGSLLMAKDDLEDVRLGAAVAEIDNVGKNRRDPSLEVDNQLTVLAFATGDGNPKAIIFNYSCHPTVLGADNLLISPDFPGAAVETLRKIYPEAVASFTNGAPGDISTRFTRRSQTLGEAERLGTILGSRVAELVAGMEFKEVADNEIAYHSLSLDIDFKDFPPVEELEEKIAEAKEELTRLEGEGAEPGRMRIALTALQGAQIQKIIAENLSHFEKTGEFDVFRLGPAGIVSMPGELFSRLARSIKDQSPLEFPFVIGYANGHLGYIPDRASYQQGGYEVLSTPLAPGFGEKIVARVSEAWEIV